MFSGEIVWKGVIYTILMIFGKICCGAWLARASFDSLVLKKAKDVLTKLPKPTMDHFWGRNSEKQPQPEQGSQGTPASTEVNAASAASQGHSSPQDMESSENESATAREPHATPAGIKPRSVYPASILGCAMTARGEIGLFISSLAESNGIFASDSDKGSSSDMFLVVTWAIVHSTILEPIAVGLVVNRVRKLQHGVEKEGRVVRGDVLDVWGVS